MSTKTEKQERAFEFLQAKCISQEPFSMQDFLAATGWPANTFKTYRSKQFKDLLIETAPGKFRVSLALRRYGTWAKFRDNVVTQNRRLTREYSLETVKNVVIFEFFLPLRNEEYLRDALDGLFFVDSLRHRLSSLDRKELEKLFPLEAGENDDHYMGRLCEWLGTKFAGYSISHVSGRYRAGKLSTRKEAAERSLANTHQYLVDETTAVVRFIFPCGSSPGEAALAADRVRWFFHRLFVGSIKELVSGEDELWLLESGMNSELTIFRAKQ